MRLFIAVNFNPSTLSHLTTLGDELRSRAERGNGFCERMGFTSRPDLVYRNKALVELERIDT